MELSKVMQAYANGEWVKDADQPTNVRIHFSRLPYNVAQNELDVRAIGVVAEVLGVSGISGGGESKKYPGGLVVAFSSGPDECAQLEGRIGHQDTRLAGYDVAQVEAADFIFHPCQ